MKKFLSFFAVALTAGSLQAFDQSAYAPGVMLSSLPETKVVDDSFLAARKPVNGIVEMNAQKELVFRPEPGKSDAEFNVYLPLPAKVSRVRISFELKAKNFFVSRKNKEFSYFMFYFGGVNMMLRGNAYGLRYFSVPKKTYIHGVSFRDGEWQNVTIDMVCGQNPVFSLNDIKNIAQRGQCDWINRLTFYGKFVNAKTDTAVYIRNLKVELPED